VAVVGQQAEGREVRALQGLHKIPAARVAAEVLIRPQVVAEPEQQALMELVLMEERVAALLTLEQQGVVATEEVVQLSETIALPTLLEETEVRRKAIPPVAQAQQVRGIQALMAPVAQVVELGVLMCRLQLAE
jgi:hypothetical protein